MQEGAVTVEAAARDAAAEAQSFDVLLDWALVSATRTLPDEVISRAALLVVDELAALFAAADEAGLRAAQDALLRNEGAGDATIMAKPVRRASMRGAAMANAMALSWMELDEGYARASCHAGLYTLPTLAASADVSGQSVHSVLTQLAVAYEVLARLAAAYPAPRFTWHPHGMWSSVGAGLASCLAAECEFDVTMRTLRMAASFANLGGYEAAIDGAEIRNVWAAIGVSNGLAAFELARVGLDGPAGAPEAVFARLTGRNDGGRRIQMTDLGERWALFDSFTKEHACCQSMHSAIEAALEIRAGDGFSLDDVAVIEIETPRMEMDNAAPRNRLAAQFSLPHAVAVTLVRGSADADSFSREAIRHPDVVGLRDLIRLKPWLKPLETANARPAMVRVSKKNGEVISRVRPGGPEMSLEERGSIIRAKIRAYGAPTFAQAEQACARLLGCDDATLRSSWRRFVESCFT